MNFELRSLPKFVTRNALSLGFGLALIILASIAFISYASIRAFAERAHRVEHTHEVLSETAAIRSDLKDAEAGVLAYAVARNESSVDSYREAIASIPVRMAHLADLIADNPRQQRRLASLQRLMDKKREEENSTFAMLDNVDARVPEAARARLKLGGGTMDEIRTLIGEMRDEEEMLLRSRSKESERSAVQTIAVIVIGNAAGFSILILAFLLLRSEVARRTRAQQDGQRLAAEVEDLYNNAPSSYHSVDRNGVFIRMNDTGLSWLGYTRDELIGKLKFIDVVAPESRQTVRDNFPSLVSGKPTINLEYTMVRKDGTTFPVSVNAVPLLDARGNYVMSRTVMFDSTAMKEAQSQIRMANTFLDAVVENIPSMIFVKEAKDLRFARINKAEEELLGIPRQALIGKTDYDFFPKEQCDFFTAKDREVLQSTSVMAIDEEELTSNGVTRILRTRKVALRDAKGQPQYLVGISDDITAQKRSEQAILTLNAALEDRAKQLELANKELESFSYSVSHDLRSPLRAIDGFARMFEEDYQSMLDDEARRLLKVIRDNSQRMGLLIDDLLSFSRLGRTPIAKGLVDMNALVGEVLDEIKGTNNSTEIVVHSLPASWCDRSLIRQVWINLLSNAFKYSGAGETPAVHVSGQQSDNEIIYCVKDNGVGFDMKYYDKLFGVFQRLHSVEEFPGTGVGLAIVQRIVSRSGGKVWAESTPGQGAKFCFTLPRRTDR